MAKKGGSSPPPAPDPAKTAAAQGAANVETAIAQALLNNVNQSGPFGNVTYTQTGTQKVGDYTIPQFQQNVTLSPEQQRQLDLQNQIQESSLGLGKQMLGNVGNAISQPFNYDGLPGLTSDFSADRQRVEQSIIDRNRPQMDRTRAALETKLANQGVAKGSEAWKNAMDDLGRQENDFNLAAIQQGGAEQSRLFGLNLQGRQQGIQERAYQRSQPINELSTLLGMGGGIQTPQFTSPQGTQIANTDVMGPINMQYQNKMAGWQANNAANQALMGSLFGLGGSLGGAAILASDRRVKTDIKRVGSTDGGLPIYTFYYKSGGPIQMGVMAQDVEKVDPSAVIEISGVKHVDYAKVA